jgi:hypothetical protein
VTARSQQNTSMRMPSGSKTKNAVVVGREVDLVSPG